MLVIIEALLGEVGRVVPLEVLQVAHAVIASRDTWEVRGPPTGNVRVKEESVKRP
jgi:hypothetical protein